ncbi:MAG: hypothetical protein CBC42_01385 [Betaproteobacteria bacterium TMED82]|nr:MAG: hypothetical protein CBC42_01385 [Betaproteobacteria bacterium TMED82]|tara:strand:- start:25800 stop:26552 length:753 start_codon:yes stop_codon:yes gene_type:complete
MTYCIASKLNSGLVFLSDSRTNAGVDDIATHRKMTVLRKDKRTFILLSAGNLAITQSVRAQLNDSKVSKQLWGVGSMYQAAEIIGRCIRSVKKRDGQALDREGVEFNCSFILGGQILGEDIRLFKIYSAGNFIEAEGDSIYFQIGETKYGKPILDRVLSPEISLDAAAKCMLLSMDSTLMSNLSVGLPLDLLVYEESYPGQIRYRYLDENDAYFSQLKENWSLHLKRGFDQLDRFDWDKAKKIDIKRIEC